MYNLFKYDNWHDLLYDNGQITCACNLTENLMMNDRIVKLHKGVDNEVKFRVFDSDRKRTRIDHLRVNATLINKENNELCFNTSGRLMTERGTFKIMFREGDIVDIAPGFYDLIITGEEWSIPEHPGDIVSTPFYSNRISDVQLIAEITTQGQKNPIPTIEVFAKNPDTEVSDWIVTNEMVNHKYARVYHSSPIPANRLRNYKNGTHTIAVTLNEFSGILQVRGSIEHLPPPEARYYFPIDIPGYGTDIYYGDLDPEYPDSNIRLPYTGTDSYSFESNLLWLMVVWIPTDNNGVPLDEQIFPIQWNEPITRLQVRS